MIRPTKNLPEMGVNGFDRKMDSRTPDFEDPTVDGSTILMNWKVTYTKAGCPDLTISGREIAEFQGDQGGYPDGLTRIQSATAQGDPDRVGKHGTRIDWSQRTGLC